MKKIFFIILTLLLYSCNTKQNNNTLSIDKGYESIKIDTIIFRVNRNDSDKCGYNILKFTYPKVSGLSKVEFQKKLNEVLLKDINLYIKTIKTNIKTYNLIHGEYQPLEGGIENYTEEIPGELYISFDVLSRDSIISIIQYYSESGLGGGNNQFINSNVTNCNIVKSKFLNNSELFTSSFDISFINNRIKTYFDKCFPDAKKENAIDYPIIKSNAELRNQNYAIRNDSIMLVLEATPYSNASYGTYIIPIDKRR